METIQKNLTTLLLVGFYAISGYDFPTTATNTKNAHRKWKLFSGLKNRSLRKRKADTFRWFHYLNNIHVLSMMTIAFYFPAEMASRPFFHFVLPITGWLSFYTLDTLVARLQKAGKSDFNNGFLYINGLCSLAGYNMQSRLLLLVALTISLLCTFTFHLSMHLLSGFILRWLMESQFRYLVNTSKEIYTNVDLVSYKAY